jgi:hypothetical protein
LPSTVSVVTLTSPAGSPRARPVVDGRVLRQKPHHIGLPSTGGQRRRVKVLVPQASRAVLAAKPAHGSAGEVARDGGAFDVRREALHPFRPTPWPSPAGGGIRRSRPHPRAAPARPPCNASSGRHGPGVPKVARSIAWDIVQWGQTMCMEHDSPTAMRWGCYKAIVNEPETMAEAKSLRWAGFLHGLRVPAGSPIDRS